MKKYIIITAIIFLISSCASKKVTITTSRSENLTFEKTADSTFASRVVKEIKQEAVKADTATAAVAISAIENLPEGAKFVEKSGRASVILKRINDTVIITAVCDSLQRLIYSYELEIENYKGKTERKNIEITTAETTYKKKTYNPFLVFFLGVAAGGLVVLIFTNQKSIFETILCFIKKLFK
jgi:hypothetical protein